MFGPGIEPGAFRITVQRPHYYADSLIHEYLWVFKEIRESVGMLSKFKKY